jgi:hypothetical protein
MTLKKTPPPDPPAEEPDLDREVVTTAPPDAPPGQLVGVVHFEGSDGTENGSAKYNVPTALRERVLVWRHKPHEANHVNGKGEWVYRQTSTAGVGALEHDADLEPLDA